VSSEQFEACTFSFAFIRSLPRRRLAEGGSIRDWFFICVNLQLARHSFSDGWSICG
jgi:hypothetical protein